MNYWRQRNTIIGVSISEFSNTKSENQENFGQNQEKQQCKYRIVSVNDQSQIQWKIENQNSFCYQYKILKEQDDIKQQNQLEQKKSKIEDQMCYKEDIVFIELEKQQQENDNFYLDKIREFVKCQDQEKKLKLSCKNFNDRFFKQMILDARDYIKVYSSRQFQFKDQFATIFQNLIDSHVKGVYSMKHYRVMGLKLDKLNISQLSQEDKQLHQLIFNDQNWNKMQNLNLEKINALKLELALIIDLYTQYQQKLSFIYYNMDENIRNKMVNREQNQVGVQQFLEYIIRIDNKFIKHLPIVLKQENHFRFLYRFQDLQKIKVGMQKMKQGLYVTRF